jgi:hypothetical protein
MIPDANATHPPKGMALHIKVLIGFALGAVLGLAVHGLGLDSTGVVTGLMAGSRYSKAERECPDHHCVEGGAGWDDVQSFRTLRTVSTVGYIVGGVGLAAGATLYLTAPSRRSGGTQTGALGVWVNARSAGLVGAF